LKRQLSIAIDGPVAAGKTVVGKEVARRLGFRFLDTGAMYRAVTWAAIHRGIGMEDEAALSELAQSIEIRLVSCESGDRLFVDSKDITDDLRSLEVERDVSLAARVSGLRKALVEQQRAVARQGPIVMVGRDIGTVVLTDADVKVFLKASVEERARRRHQEELDRGIKSDYHQVLEYLARRDEIDSSRTDSPLRPADDATQINTDNLEVEEVVERILSLVEGR
jgi:cytidylate kinase